jgi:type I restriction enzyme R subunit
MSNFDFLRQDFYSIHHNAVKAESYINTDHVAAAVYMRITLEQVVDWLFRNDKKFSSYENSLGARVHAPSFETHAGEKIFAKAKIVIDVGNRAAHGKKVTKERVIEGFSEFFHICYWLARTYATKSRPDPSMQFDPELLPQRGAADQITLKKLLEQEEALKKEQQEKDVLRSQLAGEENLRAELERLQAEIEKVKRANLAIADTHDYNEEQTRDYFIDVLLHEAGWPLDKKQDREFEVAGMPNNQNKGFIDYVLWGDDGLPLAVVEAKRTRKDAREGQQQAKLYADCLEAQFKRRPVIFYTNGYVHWFWDDKSSPPRRVQGFYKKDELELLIQRRTSKQSLALARINPEIAGRGYQQQAIRCVTEAIEKENKRRSLIVMATGAGKTRTVIALTDLLTRCNWAKRVLFLADRVSLVKQASREFVKLQPDLGIVNLLDNPDGHGRVYVSTYPTMLNLINDNKSDTRKFGIGHFDLVVVDEAHRSIYAKYGAIFDYFDSYLVGLTATPKDEVDRNTYELFELDKGVPTYAYALEDAIADQYLVPPQAISVALQFQREGIDYSKLSDEEKQQWDELDWGEDGPPDSVDPPALNAWLFNKDTVDKVLEHLMTQGERVASGDRLGKTIIFAKNNNHAEFIAERFNANYPQYKGEFARVITHKTVYAQSLIDEFSKKDSAPHIAISVDMLDTGIDVPEVVNLVFFKMVRSKTKFWQMIGRGTRLCSDLYAPGQDKKFFKIFDFCQNIEFFNQQIPKGSGKTADSLDTKLFKFRLDLIQTLAARNGRMRTAEEHEEENKLGLETTKYLHSLVAGMTLDNIIVRPHRKLVEKYKDIKQWDSLTNADKEEIANNLAALPSQVSDPEEEAKRFDMMILRLQLCILHGDEDYEKYQRTVKSIAAALELQESIPAIRNQMPLIQSLSSDDWWQDVTVGMLEHVRRQIRLLIKLLEKTQRPIVYTDFDDTISSSSSVELNMNNTTLDYEKFKAKARDFLRVHEDKLVVFKLRTNRAITAADLEELEKILLEQAAGNTDLVSRAKDSAGGLGLFVRSIIGLERGAAVDAMAEFLNDQAATASQIEFTNMLVNFLTVDGAISAERLYQSPFTAVAATGPDSIFSSARVEQLFQTIEQIRLRAVA